MSKANTNINIFKKSIESTIKAISKKTDINILFGSDNKSSYQNVNLPEVNKNKLNKSKLSIRGRSDAASLVNRYHDKNIHQRMSPANLETKIIFDEIEFLRCELLGSTKYPGIKKNFEVVLATAQWIILSIFWLNFAFVLSKLTNYHLH